MRLVLFRNLARVDTKTKQIIAIRRTPENHNANFYFTVTIISMIKLDFEQKALFGR